jgi:hypothetical protein
MTNEDAPVVYKTHNDAPDRDGFDGNEDSFSDFQIDVIAEVFAETSVGLRNEFQAAIDSVATPLRERVIALEAQISTMMALLNVDSNPAIEASETSTIRKLRVS